MKPVTRCYELLSKISAGKVYSWSELKKHSRSPGRDITRLLQAGLLKKVGPGLYLRPKKSRFGAVPATEEQLVRQFLKTKDFLLFSTNQYNVLGLGLTQLKNETVVYNTKRHDTVYLSDRAYHFKRPNNGFPKKLTKEFLLVDLINNIKFVGESSEDLKNRIVDKVCAGQFNQPLLQELAVKYGKISTKKFMNQLHEHGAYIK